MKTPVKIRVDLSTREALLGIGRKGESYDDVIRRLIEDKYGAVVLTTANLIRDLQDVEEEVRER